MRVQSIDLHYVTLWFSPRWTSFIYFPFCMCLFVPSYFYPHKNMNKRDLSNTSFAFNLGSTTFLCDYKYSIPTLNMNIITLILCYFIYIVYLCIYHIFGIVYYLYEFVDEKVENKLKSKSNQRSSRHKHFFFFSFLVHQKFQGMPELQHPGSQGPGISMLLISCKSILELALCIKTIFFFSRGYVK